MGLIDNIKEFFTMGLTKIRKGIESVFNPTEEPEEQIPEQVQKLDEKTGYEEKPELTEQLVKEKTETEFDYEDREILQNYASLLPSFVPEQAEFVNKLLEKYLKTKQELFFYKKETTRLVEEVEKYKKEKQELEEKMNLKYTINLTLTGEVRVFAMISILEISVTDEQLAISMQPIYNRFTNKTFQVNIGDIRSVKAKSASELEERLNEFLNTTQIRSYYATLLQSNLYLIVDDLRRDFNFYNLSEKDFDDSVIIELISMKAHNDLTNLDKILEIVGSSREELLKFETIIKQLVHEVYYQNYVSDVEALKLNAKFPATTLKSEKYIVKFQYEISISPNLELKINIKLEEIPE